MNLGLAFQLVDDALDYGGTAADLGKNVGDDFREGKITLPVVLAYRRGTEGERDVLAQGHRGRATSTTATSREGDGLMQQIRRDLRDTDRARAALWRHRPRRARAADARSAHKDALLEVIDFCIDRAN